LTVRNPGCLSNSHVRERTVSPLSFTRLFRWFRALRTAIIRARRPVRKRLQRYQMLPVSDTGNRPELRAPTGWSSRRISLLAGRTSGFTTVWL